ncbi:ThiF family adenylyltransferase [Aliivibrio fischeri]|uniref:ThiF family adenylyltransferase n=1 Tax=Aliivibrio fischeri TaxID=668 RepID=UPI0007C529D9|nr:ThiF family adenylyltransferase [Aliivibrio fischeri]MCE7576180.1 ThiF family adenylyltransferase [Aliivibrio fischeri]MCE7588470.1 ThiF family adenylyltransferase [Aliivibrio fischeri]TGA72020.1 ThiF family adenylyltransferase [Aliivibrio fischeri]
MNKIMIKPLLKKSHHIILADDGDVCIGEVPEVSQIIEKPPEWLAHVLGKLDGKRTVPRIIKELSAENIYVNEENLNNLIEQLHSAKLLQDNSYYSPILNNEEIERYDRQILQFGLIDNDNVHPYIYQERLKKSKVSVFGMGGWGTWCSLLLAQAGVGTLRLIDGDDVELSNVNRQVLYKTQDVGMQKVEAAKASIQEFNPNVAVECFDEFAAPNREDLERLIGDSTFIIIAWASLGYYRKDTVEEILHSIAKDRQIPIIELGGDPLEISIGPLYPNDGLHLNFSEVQNVEQSNFYDSNLEIRKFQEARLKHSFIDGDRDVNAWQSAPSLAAMAGLASDQIIKFITKYDNPYIIGKRVYLTLNTFEKREVTVFEYEKH